MSHVTENIGLEIWDQKTDDFEGPELAQNFENIDKHNHTGPPHGVKLGTEAYENKSITGEKIAEETIEGKNIKDKTIGPGQLEGSSLVPLGAIIAWEPPTGVTSPGGLFEICDGREWKNIENKMGTSEAARSSGNILDLRDKFILGADITGTKAPKPGVEGGKASYNLNHAHSVSSHTHTTPAHTHGISTAGSHNHQFNYAGKVGPTTYSLFQQAVQAHITGKEEAQALHLLPVETETELEIPIETAGAHNHSGATEVGGSGTTGAATPGTNAELGTINIEPVNYALIYIQRVR